MRLLDRCSNLFSLHVDLVNDIIYGFFGGTSVKSEETSYDTRTSSSSSV